jgi:LPXTG-motif cell wall-anchored protein
LPTQSPVATPTPTTSPVSSSWLLCVLGLILVVGGALLVFLRSKKSQQV